MSKKISIIIPAHNEENYIRRTLHSIKNQTYQDYETIIVANGCSDRTEEIVKKRENNKFKLFSLPQANVSIARNYGAGQAQGEILLFLDADTTLEADSLKKINEQFTEKHAVATTKVKADENKLKYRLAMRLKNGYHLLNLYQGCSGALICRKKDFDGCGGYDQNLIVKENRKLILKLKRGYGKFTCLDTYVTTSMRRFKQWGLIKATLFWLKQWVKNYSGNLSNSNYEKIR